MAKALLDTVLGKLKTDDAPAYEILEEMKGSALEYREYEPLYDCAGEATAKQGKKAHFVTCDGYVTTVSYTHLDVYKRQRHNTAQRSVFFMLRADP